MNTLAKLKKSIGAFFDATAKARVHSTLLCMGRDWVERHGYSWTLLRKGVSHWPWRQTPEARAEELETRRAIRELKSFSDRQLHDLGINRKGVEHAVRHGNADAGFDAERKRSVA